MFDPAEKFFPAAAWAAVLGLLAAGGCGQSTATVSGRVTLDGKPVGPGAVIFIPAENGPPRQSAMGQFGPDGRYELTTFEAGDGALVGEYRVLVQASGQSYGQESADAQAASPIPLLYSDPQQSGLRATVQAGLNQIDLPLKSQPDGA